MRVTDSDTEGVVEGVSDGIGQRFDVAAESVYAAPAEFVPEYTVLTVLPSEHSHGPTLTKPEPDGYGQAPEPSIV